ncbi:MAG: DUF4179 domain-containing protein [Lachnospiraceae bacterium]|nr:DUF4179 domain-containing protein [Lachnospiraceae bacterium]
MTEREEYLQAFSEVKAPKNLTWQRICRKREEEKRRAHRNLVRIAVAVFVIVLVGGGGAYAAGVLKPVTEIFAKVFTLSQGGEQLAENVGQSIGETVTANGVCVTLDGVLRDSQNCALLFSLKSEDGKAITGNGEQEVGFADVAILDETGTELTCGGEDLTVKQKGQGLQVAVIRHWRADMTQPKQVMIRLTDICNLGETVSTLEEGEWDFRIPFAQAEDGSQRIAHNQIVKLWDSRKNRNAEVLIEELTVSPFGFQMVCTGTERSGLPMKKMASLGKCSLEIAATGWQKRGVVNAVLCVFG